MILRMLLIAILVLTTTVNAQVEYTNRAAFEAALGTGFIVDDFDGYPMWAWWMNPVGFSNVKGLVDYEPLDFPSIAILNYAFPGQETMCSGCNGGMKFHARSGNSIGFDYVAFNATVNGKPLSPLNDFYGIIGYTGDIVLEVPASGGSIILDKVTVSNVVIPACQQCGDCNGDGQVNVLDALNAAKIALGLGTGGVCCDVDGRLGVTILDALLISQFSAGIPVTLMCP